MKAKPSSASSTTNTKNSELWNRLKALQNDALGAPPSSFSTNEKNLQSRLNNLDKNNRNRQYKGAGTSADLDVRMSKLGIHIPKHHHPHAALHDGNHTMTEEEMVNELIAAAQEEARMDQDSSLPTPTFLPLQNAIPHVSAGGGGGGGEAAAVRNPMAINKMQTIAPVSRREDYDSLGYYDPQEEMRKNLDARKMFPALFPSHSEEEEEEDDCTTDSNSSSRHNKDETPEQGEEEEDVVLNDEEAMAVNALIAQAEREVDLEEVGVVSSGGDGGSRSSSSSLVQGGKKRATRAKQRQSQEEEGGKKKVGSRWTKPFGRKG